MTDIFDFWSRIKRGEKVHPADQAVFHRMDPERHGFEVECLPACYGGTLKTAPVVFLFLSPGFIAESDLADATTEDGKDYYFRRWKGNEPFRDDGPGKDWLLSRTKRYCDYEVARNNVAVLNIGAYHSKNVKDFASLMALPSSRVSLSWAQQVLFPQAERGERIVVCMRSPAYWGLAVGEQYGKCLFAPAVNRSGHLLKNRNNQKLEELIRERLQRVS